MVNLLGEYCFCSSALHNLQAREVKRLIIFLATACLSISAFSSIALAREVKKISIEKTGQSYFDGEADKKSCEKFQPTTKQIKRFFSRAVPVDRYYLHHDWRSSCYAEGSVVFTGGGEGEWRLYSGGLATLTWAFTESEIVLYNGRNNGWRDSDACSYGGSTEECFIPGF